MTARAESLTDTAMPKNETTIPVLPCASLEDTLDFYEMLGFEVTYKQKKPYLYLALRCSGFEVHFGAVPEGMDPSRENGGGCLVMVDEVAPYHREFTRSMRRAHGKVLASGRPRITRLRPGASRFTLVDPSGNSLIFIQRDEPAELEYGGSKELQGLAKALDNARIFRDFKNDDLAAFRAVKSALRRHGDKAAPVDRALALATLVELAIARDDRDGIDEWIAELRSIPLNTQEKRVAEDKLREATNLESWLADTGNPPGQ
ncbi:glyoxalase [Saccharopolyspora erythraea]|nr:glyoxalase [Saccharopolyspora erythraea]